MVYLHAVGLFTTRHLQPIPPSVTAGLCYNELDRHRSAPQFMQYLFKSICSFLETVKALAVTARNKSAIKIRNHIFFLFFLCNLILYYMQK